MDIAESIFLMQEQIYNLRAENERLKEKIKQYENDKKMEVK